jgi:hypothetical protein
MTAALILFLLPCRLASGSSPSLPLLRGPPMDICLAAARAAASRRNGAKSRGPKTAEGKARSAQNALRHGLRAQQFVVVGDEDPQEFAALEAALVEELAPQGALQSVLAARIARAAWPPERGWGPVPQPGGQGGRGVRAPCRPRAQPRACADPRRQWRQGIRHAAALSRHDAGRAVARTAAAQGAPGRAGSAARARRGTRAASPFRATGKANRTQSLHKCSRNHARITRGWTSAVPAGAHTA